jgi:hypothetical protein
MLSAEEARRISYDEGCIFKYTQDLEKKIRYAASRGETKFFYMIEPSTAQAMRLRNTLRGAGYDVKVQFLMNDIVTFEISWA